MKNSETISLNFGGFYNSLHSDLIENLLEYYYDETDYSELDIPYKDLEALYSKHYINFLSKYMQDKYKYNITFEFIRVDNPKFYNYHTDAIETSIASKSIDFLINLFKDDNDFNTYLKERCKSYSGYMSFYTYDEAKQNTDDILIVYIMDYILDNKDILSAWLNYYYNDYVYEICSEVDMPIVN